MSHRPKIAFNHHYDNMIKTINKLNTTSLLFLSLLLHINTNNQSKIYSKICLQKNEINSIQLKIKFQCTL
jgi:hypothetical protein